MTQAHGTEDAGKPPLILVLQVAAGAELVNADGDRVRAGADQIGHVELVGQARAARHPHPRAVDPHGGLAFNTVEAQGDDPFPPTVRQVEGAAVVADGILLGRVGRVHREGEVDVRVGGAPVEPVLAQHPVAGDVDIACDGLGRRLGPGALSIDEGIGICAEVCEAPGSIEADHARVVGQMGAGRQEGARAGRVGRYHHYHVCVPFGCRHRNSDR